MRVTPCVRFALILAVLFTRTVSVHPSGMTEEAKEDAEQPAAMKADFKPPLRTKLGMTRQDLNSLCEVSQRT